MNQAILKILDDIAKESIESFGESIPSGSYPKWIKIAKDRISSLPSDTQWIDVKDELPKDGKIVLINEGGIVIHGYNEGGTMYKLPTDKLSYCTHWMPLPLPPNN